MKLGRPWTCDSSFLPLSAGQCLLCARPCHHCTRLCPVLTEGPTECQAQSLHPALCWVRLWSVTNSISLTLECASETRAIWFPPYRQGAWGRDIQQCSTVISSYGLCPAGLPTPRGPRGQVSISAPLQLSYLPISIRQGPSSSSLTNAPGASASGPGTHRGHPCSTSRA